MRMMMVVMVVCVGPCRLHLKLKMKPWRLMSLQDPQHPLLLNPESEQRGLTKFCPSVEAFRVNGVRIREGVREEEAGPDPRSTGQPPSHNS